MADNSQAIEWYLARDGQQHGPISEAELGKIIELGYLKPSDLVWRQGWAEWKPASVVLPPAGQAASPPLSPQPPTRPESAARPAAAPPGPAAPHAAGQLRGDGGQLQVNWPSTTDEQRGGTQNPHVTLDPPSGPAGAGNDGYPRRQPAPQPTQPINQAGFGRAGAGGPASQPAPYHPASQGDEPTTPRKPMRTDGPGRAEGPVPVGAPYGPHAGMPEPGTSPRWQTDGNAKTALPLPHPGPMPPRRDPAASVDAQGPGPVADYEEDYDNEGRGFPWRTAVVLVVLAGLGGGAYALHRTGQLSSLPFLDATGSSKVPVVEAPRAPATTKPADPAPTKAAAATTSGGGFEAHMQASPLWRLLQREFPEWYNERLTAVRTQTVEGKGSREISNGLLRDVVTLRRQNSAPALAASPLRLRAIAAAFVNNLNRLKEHSTAACYGFISQGETSTAVSSIEAVEVRGGIDAQLHAIFSAVAEGRKSPVQHASPGRADYDVLTAELAKRGWNTADLQMFANARALERAAPEKVCQMVNDWFSAQLAVQDATIQTRLLSEALKPIVAG